jgi:hypothetical protein
MVQDSPNRPTSRRPSEWRSIWIGATIGLTIGAAWTAVFGPLTDGPPSLWLSLAVYTIGFAVTGAVVDIVRRFPELVGLSSGSLTLAVLAVLVGPKNGWIVLWVFVFGGAGLLWGTILGVLFRFFRPRDGSEPVAAADGGDIDGKPMKLSLKFGAES